MTVADEITAALFDLGLLQSGEVPDPDDQAFAFARFNDWVDSLKLDGLSPYSVINTLWTLTSAVSYTIGTGATINVDRPVNPQAIQNIGFIDNNNSPANEILCGLPLTEDAWASIVQKSFTSTYPTSFYYQTVYPATGFGLIYPWPIPTTSNLQGSIYTLGQVGEFATVQTSIVLPPGYRRFFRTNLAIELASAFDVDVKPSLIKASQDSMAAVKRANYRLQDMSSPAADLFRGNRQNVNIYIGVE